MINRTAKLLLAKRAEAKRLGEALQRAHCRLHVIALYEGLATASIAKSGEEDAKRALDTCGLKPLTTP